MSIWTSKLSFGANFTFASLKDLEQILLNIKCVEGAWEFRKYESLL